MKIYTYSILVFALLILGPPLAYGDICATGTLKQKIENCTSGITVVKGPTRQEDFDVYDLRIQQPMDHFNPNSPTFKQRFFLFHRSKSRPMVLSTSGYKIFNLNTREITGLMQANEILVEHRYFDSSIPKDPNWEKLNIEQSAYDFHRIVEEMKKLYPSKWVNTGHSKGGMTSVYHRRFFPDDLDATVAYVAPISFSTSDPRYTEFLLNVGGEALSECRTRLENMRKEVLRRKRRLVRFLGTESYTRFGGKLQALEVAASESYFVFFQYRQASDCNQVPSANVSDRVLFKGFDKIADVSGYADETIKIFEPYFYQSATQLGGPASGIELLGELIEFPSAFELSKIAPKGVSLSYDPKPMQDVDQWVQDKSEKIMYIYGEYDPWTAAPFRLGSSVNRDSHLFMAPQGNHGARIASLSESDQVKAKRILSRWMDVEIDDSIDFVDSAYMEERHGLRP